jgi:predicted Fe-Mo cluster-binding NifX family protein
MKVAVSTDSGKVAEHFGRCPEFTLAEIENGKVVSMEVIPNPGHATGFLPKFFNEKGVEVVVAGGAGFRAQGFFQEFGIRLVLGISGPVEQALERLAKGELESGQGFCSPGAGKGYGIPKEDGHGE